MKYQFFCFLLAFSFASCDDNYYSSIPDYPVNLQLNLTSTYPTFKNSTNQFLLFKTRKFDSDRIGYGGILVYSGLSLDDSGNTQFYAFDMSCPYEVKPDVRVFPNDRGQAICEKCGSVYDIGFGNGLPSSGPSKEALKRYRTMLSGDYLIISR